MKKPLPAILLTALIVATTLVFVLDAPAWARLLLPLLSLVFFLKVFVRGKSRRTLKDSTNLGGGYQSGGPITGRASTPDATGSGGLDASSTNIIGAGASNNSGTGHGQYS